MKITKQLLEEMIKEEINEGWKERLAGLGAVGTIVGAFLAAEPHLEDFAQEQQYEIMQGILDDMSPDEAAEKAQAVIDGTDEEVNSLPEDAQEVAVDVATDYLNENRSRLERIIAEELQKVLKA